MEDKSSMLNSGNIAPKTKPILLELKLLQNEPTSFQNCLEAIDKCKQTLVQEDALYLTIEGKMGKPPYSDSDKTIYYEIEEEQLEYLGNTLEKITQLKSLTVKGWGGMSFNSELLDDFFEKIAFLEKIVFDQCDIREEINAEKILAYDRLRELSFLGCDNNLSTWEFMNSLIKGLEKNTCLKKLSLAGNDLDLFVGHLMEDFLEAVKNHPTLEEIDLRGNAWTTAPILTTAGQQTYLGHFWSYDHLKLERYIGRSTHSLKELLTHSNQLKKLYLGFKKDSSHVSKIYYCFDEVISQIAMAIQHNTTLTHLSFSHLSFKSMQALVNALRCNFTLLYLEMTNSDNPRELKKEMDLLLKRNYLLKAGIDFLQFHFQSIQKWIKTNEPIDSIILSQVFAITLELMEYKKIEHLADNRYFSNQIRAIIDSFDNQLLPVLFPSCVKLFAEQLMQPKRRIFPEEVTRNTGIRIFIEHLFGMDLNLPLPTTKEKNEENKKSKFKLLLLIMRYYQGTSSQIEKVKKYCLADYLDLVDYSKESTQARFTIANMLNCDQVLTVSQFLSLLRDEQNNPRTIEELKEIYDKTIVIYEQVLLDKTPKVINLKNENLSDLIASHLILKDDCIKEEKALLEGDFKIEANPSTNLKQLETESEKKEVKPEEKSPTKSQQPSIINISLFKVPQENNPSLPPADKNLEEKNNSSRAPGQQ